MIRIVNNCDDGNDWEFTPKSDCGLSGIPLQKVLIPNCNVILSTRAMATLVPEGDHPIGNPDTIISGDLDVFSKDGQINRNSQIASFFGLWPLRIFLLPNRRNPSAHSFCTGADPESADGGSMWVHRGLGGNFDGLRRIPNNLIIFLVAVCDSIFDCRLFRSVAMGFEERQGLVLP